MKKVLVCAFLVFFISATFAASNAAARSKISKEEYEIYSLVFNKMFEGGVVTFDTQSKIKTLVIKNYTVNDQPPLTAEGGYLEQIKEMIPALSLETVNGFISANEKEVSLKKAFKLELNHVLVEKSELKKIFKEETGMSEMSEWEKFYEKYPDSGGIVSVSRVGFNPAKDQALVYMEHWCRSTCGTGHYILLGKEQNEWKFLKSFSPWIS